MILWQYITQADYRVIAIYKTAPDAGDSDWTGLRINDAVRSLQNRNE